MLAGFRSLYTMYRLGKEEMIKIIRWIELPMHMLKSKYHLGSIELHLILIEHTVLKTEKYYLYCRDITPQNMYKRM